MYTRVPIVEVQEEVVHFFQFEDGGGLRIIGWVVNHVVNVDKM